MRAIVITGVGAPNTRTETAIATAIIARGSTTATTTHRTDAGLMEKPSNSRPSWPPPRTAERMSAVMLGPESAMTFRTAPPDVSMLIDMSAMPHQIAHEIAKVSATKARSCCRPTRERASRSSTVPTLLWWASTLTQGWATLPGLEPPAYRPARPATPFRAAFRSPR
jgi:hypothetical protein